MPHQCTQCGTTFADGSKEMLSGCPDCGNNKFQYRPGDVDAESGAGAAGEPSSTPDAESTPGRSSDHAGADRDAGVTDRVNRATKTVREWVGTDRDDAPSRRDADVTADRGATAERDETPDHERSEPLDHEDTAQASARSDVVDPDELPERRAASDAPTVEESTTPEESSPAGQPPTAGGPSAAEGLSPAEQRTGGSRATQPTDAEAPPGPSGPEAGTSPNDSSDAAGADQETAPAADDNVVEAPDDDTPDLDELRKELNQQFESIKIVEPGQYELNLMELYDRQEYIISLKEDGRYAIEVPETWRDDDV